MAQEPDIDVGAITEALNNKTDTDVQNTTTIGSAQIAHFASPSTYNVDITLKASGQTYTAPADGWFSISGLAAGNSYAIVMECNYVVTTSRTVGVNGSIACSVYCGMGDTMTLLYDGFSSLGYFKFVYARGCEPQS